MQHLPNSSYRRDGSSFIKLLTRVLPEAPCGFGWEGKTCKPGQKFPPSELPSPAIALECATCETTNRTRSQRMWILWRYDFETAEWMELARAQSADWTWSISLRPLAVRLLDPEPVPVDTAPIAKQLSAYIDGELHKLSRELQCMVISSLDVHITGHMARLL